MTIRRQSPCPPKTSPIIEETLIAVAVGSSVPGCQDDAEGCYLPSVATTDVGNVAVMTNDDNAAHTFTSGTPEGGPRRPL